MSILPETAVPDTFEYHHAGSELIYGRGSASRLGPLLADRGLERALVVCGRNAGANRDVMGPVERGLGDRLAGVFDGTTPEKLAETAYEAVEAVRAVDADVLVGVGGGSSLDIARQASVLADDGRSLADLRSELADTGRVGRLEADDPRPVVVVPTTLPGADVSSGGSLEVASAADSPTGQPVRTSGSVTPFAALYDPALFETTPHGALAGSAMNGFNKGVETLYAKDATPITDATAMHGLGLLADGVRRLDDPDGIERAIVGAVLVQFENRTSVLHGFGHGFSRRYDVQQGVAHAVVTPAVLQYLFERVDGRRDLIARGLGLDTAGLTPEAVAAAVVSEVADLRDALGLPTRIRDLPGTDRDDLPAIAAFVVDDPVMRRAPPELDATADDLEGVLREAW